MQTEPLTFYPEHPSNMKTLLIETTPMRALHQDAPIPVESLAVALKDDLEGALAIYEDKRFNVREQKISIAGIFQFGKFPLFCSLEV